MRVLELFCGTKSFTKVAEARGHECLTLDIDRKFNPDLCMDIMDFNYYDMPWHTDMIWASPPCECFSVNTIGRNWNLDRTPKTDKAAHALKVVERTVELIRLLNPTYYLIENPRAMLRKMPVMAGLPRKTVTYCQYGDGRMKPTDLWTNIPIEPRACNYGDPCHPRTPRGCYSGKSYAELSIVPEQLCSEVVAACEEGLDILTE